MKIFRFVTDHVMDRLLARQKQVTRDRTSLLSSNVYFVKSKKSDGELRGGCKVNMSER